MHYTPSKPQRHETSRLVPSSGTTSPGPFPVGEAREFAEELRAVSKSPVAYAELPNAQHAFDIFGSPRGHQSAEAVARFLSWVYATSYLNGD